MKLLGKHFFLMLFKCELITKDRIFEDDIHLKNKESMFFIIFAKLNEKNNKMEVILIKSINFLLFVNSTFWRKI